MPEPADRCGIDYDPFSPESLEDPFPQWKELRERCPVHHFDGFSPPFYNLTRHRDVMDALRNVEVFSNRYGPTPQFSPPIALNQDPPEHTEFRRLFQSGFTPRMVGRLEDEIEELASELVDAMVPKGAHGCSG